MYACVLFCFFFFFSSRRRHTRFDCDWSSDVCSSDLAGRAPAPSHGTTVLSPFDSLLWHRGRAARVFGFDYRIEVYTPGPKRVHGYYVLPILHHGHLIGRLDAKAHRVERRLEVRHVHFEPWFASAQVSP